MKIKEMPFREKNQHLLLYLVFCIVFIRCGNASRPIEQNDFDSLKLSDFVERDFPFISTSLDARDLGGSFPVDNIVSRGLALQLADNAYVSFDTDLLRWSVGWTGPQLPMVLLPQVSYHDFFDKSNDIPRIKGLPTVANGMYPGWTINKMIHHEVRPDRQNREGFYWGALPSEYGRWNGVYTYGQQAILSYSVGITDINEMPGYMTVDIGDVFTRTFEIDASDDTLYLNALEVVGGHEGTTKDGLGYIYHQANKDRLTSVAIKANDGILYPVHAVSNRYLSVEFPPSNKKRVLTVYMWKGAASQIGSFKRVVEESEIELLPFQDGGPPHWEAKVHTKGQISPDTAAFVIDVLTLPLPNPWGRNMRVMDIAFLTPTKAAVVTLSGDVWLVEGISDKLNHLKWKRYASGLFEPMSIEVRDDRIYVFGKEGIVRLHDLNGDDEADFYENFSNVMDQSIESREWATDMVLAPDGGFYIAKGGTAMGGPGLTPMVAPGFRAGSNHSGTVIKISPDGQTANVIATGLRVPYLGLRSADGMLSATDQQGNFVPSTPIYFVEPGDYFGVPATKHTEEALEMKQPLTWIPHRVDRSKICSS